MTYQDYIEKIEKRINELGITKNEYYCTDEYKLAYPKIVDQYKKEFGEYKKIRRKNKKVVFGSQEFYAILFC
jgi:hypothetical protein